MSRFTFCNCPAGFDAEPERHAPDCPGRSGAGKARTPVPATKAITDDQRIAVLENAYVRAGEREHALRVRLAEQKALLQLGLEMINRGIVSFDDQIEYRQKLAALECKPVVIGFDPGHPDGSYTAGVEGLKHE